MSLCRAFFLAACLIICPSLMAQNSPQPAGQTVNYPDNPDGLKNLMADIFSAAKSKDTATESRLLDNLFLPADSHWFVDQFGPAYGPRMAERYAASTSGLKDQMSLIIANNIQRGWEALQVNQFANSATTPSPLDRILDNMNKPQPIYGGRLTGRGLYFEVGKMPLVQNAGDLDGYFFFIDGGFRFIDIKVFLILGGGRPMRIHLNPNQVGIAIIKEANYGVPVDLLKRHLQGTVVIHLAIDTQGNIKEITATQGDPDIAKFYIDTWKQYRFAPTFLDGDAVEVETDLTFTFGGP